MGDDDKRRGNGFAVLLVALLGLLGIRAAVPDSSTGDRARARQGRADQKARGDDESAPGPTAAESGPFWPPVIDFRGAAVRTNRAAPPEASAGWRRCLDLTPPAPTGEHARRQDDSPDVDGWESRFLIACLPNPDESSSRDRFDSLVDAIQRAVETQGYVLDRFYYPWAGRPGSDPGDARRRDGSAKPARADDHGPGAAPGRRHTPGMLLFRSPPRWVDRTAMRDPPFPDGAPIAAGSALAYLKQRVTGEQRSAAATAVGSACWFLRPGLLQVLLVGETATAGVDKEALQACFTYVGKTLALQECRRRGRLPDVLLLGPYFSGSQASLEQVIQARPADMATAVNFRLISGSANAVQRNEMQAAARYPDTVSFNATVAREGAIFGALLEHLRLGHRPPGQGHTPSRYEFYERFAILYESNTAFGQRAVKGIDHSPKNENGPILFPFPLHISEVRDEYERSPGGAADNEVRLPAFGNKLRLPLVGGKELREAEPSLDAAATAVVSERTLNSMLNVIDREGIRYAFIIATDVKDQLFLAQVIRRHCPECRLVLPDSNLLYGHPQFSADLRGTFVASPYPLYSDNQRWSPPFAGRWSRLLLPGPEEAGYYNATALLLNPHERASLVAYGPPFPGLWSDNIYPLVPPVWVSIVGEGGLYPLTAVPAALREDAAHPEFAIDYRDYTYPTRERGPAGEQVDASAADPAHRAELLPATPLLWDAILAGLALLLGWTVSVYVIAVFFPRRGTRADAGRRAGDPYRALAVPEGLRWKQRLYALVCLSLAAVTYGYVASVRLIPLAHIVANTYEHAIKLNPRPHESGLSLWWERANDLGGVLLVDSQSYPVQLTSWQFAISALVCLPMVALAVTILARLCVLTSAWQGAKWLHAHAATGWTVATEYATRGWNQAWQACTRLLARLRGSKPVNAGSTSLASKEKVDVTQSATAEGCARAGDTAKDGRRRRLGRRPQFEREMFGPIIVAIVCLALILFLVMYPFVRYHHSPVSRPVDHLLFFVRTTNISNGVSSAMPAVLLGGALYLWGYIQLKRLAIRERWKGVSPFPKAPKVGAESRWLRPVADCRKKADEDVTAPWRAVAVQWNLLVWCVLAFTLFRVACRFTPAAEWLGVEVVLAAGLAMLAIAIVVGWMHLRKVWGSVRELLRAVARLPLDDAFDRIPVAVKSVFGPYLSYARDGRRQFLPYRLQQYHLLAEDYQRAAGRLRGAAQLPDNVADELDAAFEEPDKAGKSWRVLPRASRASLRALAYLWDRPEQPDRPDGGNPGDPRDDSAVCAWRKRAEAFIAMEVTVEVSQFCSQLRNLAIYLSVAPLLLLLAASSYPFQPQRLWILLAGGLIALAAFTIIRNVFQAERDEVMSKIQKTTPDHIDLRWGFLSHVVLYAAPILGIVVTMSNDASDLVHAFVDPVLEVLK